MGLDGSPSIYNRQYVLFSVITLFSIEAAKELKLNPRENLTAILQWFQSN
jgi:hypothetical protein